MVDTDRQARYRSDARVLGVIGDHLSRTSLPLVEVRIPRTLADAAVVAWERDDESVPDVEDLDQRIQRHRAGALALLGLAITQNGRFEGNEMIVRVQPDVIGEALAAADDLPGDPEH